MNSEKTTEHGVLSITNDKNSSPLTTEVQAVQHNDTVITTTTTQYMDCSKDLVQLKEQESEIQYKKAVHTFTIWNISLEASPGRVRRCLHFYGKAKFLQWRTQGTKKAAVFEIKFKNRK